MIDSEPRLKTRSLQSMCGELQKVLVENNNNNNNNNNAQGKVGKGTEYGSLTEYYYQGKLVRLFGRKF